MPDLTVTECRESSSAMGGWSDPLIELQYARFAEHLRGLEKTPPVGNLAVQEAEYLCEWSRSLMSRSFGCITADEFSQLAELFRRAAALVEDSAKTVSDAAQRERIDAYAEHIAHRTSLDMDMDD